MRTKIEIKAEIKRLQGVIEDNPYQDNVIRAKAERDVLRWVLNEGKK